MDTEYGKLTVFFENPFWVGVFERVSKGKLSVCKVTFGAEPKDYEVWEFILKHYHKLAFGPAIEAEVKKTADNPKRRQREARKQLCASGVGTKSQQALQMQREEKILPQVKAIKVAVVTNPESEETKTAAELVKDGILDFIQLHGISYEKVPAFMKELPHYFALTDKMGNLGHGKIYGVADVAQEERCFVFIKRNFGGG